MLIPDISKRPWRNIDQMIAGLCGAIDGLVTFCSLGFCFSNLRLNYLRWRLLKTAERTEHEVANGK